MDQAEIVEQLGRLTLSLQPRSDPEASDLRLTRRLLAQTLARGPQPEEPLSALEMLNNVVGEARLVEPSAVPDEARREIHELAGEAVEGTPIEGFPMLEGLDLARRSVPFRTTAIPFSMPTWAAGRRVERTFGPFLDLAGRPFWFDLFRRARHIPVVRAPATTPILMLPLQGLLSGTAEYRLAVGSVWILSKLLAHTAPSGGYCGLRIKSGTLRLSSPATVVGGTLQIGAGTTITLDIETDSPSAPAPAGSLGPDAQASQSAPPTRARFVLAATGAMLERATDATMTAYGESVTLKHNSAVGVYDRVVNRVMLPFGVTADRFRITQVRSRLFMPSGEAATLGGAWALPVAIAPPDTLGEAEGAGAVAVRLATGLRATWRGFVGGTVGLGESVVMTESGRLLLAATRATGPGTSQTLHLWQEADDPRTRSDLVLGYATPSPLRFFSEAGTAEAVQINATLEASLDRPLAVDGHRFPLGAASTSAIFWQDPQDFRVLVVADLPTGGTLWHSPKSLALSNALIPLTAPHGLLVYGLLPDPSQLAQGIAAVVFGVRTVIPTLRDPYVTNFLPLGQHGQPGVAAPTLTARLLSLVGWQQPSAPLLALHLLPATSGQSVATTGEERPLATTASAVTSQPVGNRPWANPRSTGSVAEHSGASGEPLPLMRSAAEAQPSVYLRALVSEPQQAAGEDRQAEMGLRRIFEETAGPAKEDLLLLDVSTRIDQFGVGFGINFEWTHWTGPFPVLQIEGLDLAAPCQNLRVVLLPQFQWEPVVNLPNPNVGPFPDRLASATDGGPSRIGTNSVTLVPIAPEQVAEQLLKEFEAQGTPLAALFTLPFGMKAAARFQPRSSVGGSWTSLSFNRPATADGLFTGGLQIAAKALSDAGPPAESPSFPGAAWQTRNGIDPVTLVPLGLSVLAAGFGNPGVEAFFNQEMGPTGSRRRVPVTRLDFSGYGASTFSAWSNPNAVSAVSQVRFDVVVGRTSYEVVQVASILYPWAVPVVRTITIQRRKEGAVVRADSGWVAVGPGLYQYPQPDPAVLLPSGWTTIETHPGLVCGAWNIRRIRETGRVISRDFSGEQVELLEVRFDADFDIEGAVSGQGPDGRVPGRDQIGFVQRKPTGYPLLPEHLAAIMDAEGPIGGAIDCIVDIGQSGQHLHVVRIDVSPAPRPFGGVPQFAAAARGTLAFPRDGEWSTDRHDLSVDEPQPTDAHAGVPVVRQGTASGVGISSWYRIAEPGDLLRENSPSIEFGLIQGSAGHRVLFPRPRILQGQARLSSTERPVLADTYTLSTSVGIFPRTSACFIGEQAWGLDIGPDGRYTLQPSSTMRFQIPPQVADRRLVDAGAFSIRTRYSGDVWYTLDPTQPVAWVVEVTGIRTTMDLGPFEELLGIQHDFHAEDGQPPAFVQPEMVYPSYLAPVVEIIRFLTDLLGIDNTFTLKGYQSSYKFRAALSLNIVNPRSPDGYIDFGGMQIKGKLGAGVASAPTWNGFFNVELGAKVPVIPPVLGGGEVSIGLEGNEVSQQTVTIGLKWSASIGGSLGPFTVKGTFFFGIEVSTSTAGSWQVGLLVGIAGTADIWIVKITVKLELLAAIRSVAPDNHKEALGRAKFAAEITICWFVTISVEYTIEYSERVNI
jgi:hypothetical protein